MESLWIDTHIHPKFRRGLTVKETKIDDSLYITIRNPSKEHVNQRLFEYMMQILIIIKDMEYSFGYELRPDSSIKSVTINILNIKNRR